MVIEKDILYKKKRTSSKRTIKKSSKRRGESSKRTHKSSNKYDNENVCKSEYKLRSHTKYKYFKSSIEYALDWKDCQRLIPLNDKKVLNTLKYMFFKIKSGVYIEIKNNKIYNFVPFYNIFFKNTWGDKIEGDFEKFVETYYKHKRKIIEYNKEKWTALNCKIKFMNMNEQEEDFHQFKYLLNKILKNKKIKDCRFFFNKKDFPILKKKGYEPYHHIYGENVPLTSHNFDIYAPILSYGNRLNIFQDIMIPTPDCINIVTQKFFPSMCNNSYIDNDLKKILKNNKKIVRGCPWDKKKKTCIWRGSATGCANDFKNPRLLISKINQEWKNDKKLKGYLNAGITKVPLKSSKYIGENQLSKVDLNKLGLKLIEPISMKEQMEYKYILDIEGNASAYRLGYLLSFKSVLLKVESEYKIWIDEFLKPHVHYLPIRKDFSDLAITIEWCKGHDKACEKIANNAFELFKKCYNEDFLINYVSKKLNKLKPMKFS